MLESSQVESETRHDNRLSLPKNVWRGVLVIWVACSLGLLAMSLVPGHSVPSIALLGWDKLAHSVSFSGLGVLTAALLIERRSWIIPTLVYCGFMGFLSEWLQSLAPGRDASMADIFADMVGVAAAIVVTMAWTRLTKYRQAQIHNTAKQETKIRS